MIETDSGPLAGVEEQASKIQELLPRDDKENLSLRPTDDLAGGAIQSAQSVGTGMNGWPNNGSVVEASCHVSQALSRRKSTDRRTTRSSEEPCTTYMIESLGF